VPRDGGHRDAVPHDGVTVDADVPHEVHDSNATHRTPHSLRDMDIVVTGSSGLIGTALVQRLRADGHTVRPLVRRAATAGEISWDPTAGTLDRGALEGVDAVVNLAGAGIGDHRWSDAYKRELVESRTRTTELLATSVAGLDRKPAVLLSGSAIGWYGDRGDDVVDERSAPGVGFLSELCVAWEATTAPAEAAGIRVAHLRTGIVLAKEGGALKKQLPLFKVGLGGRFGKGNQWQSWISLADEIGAIEHLLTADVSGAVNLTAPNPVTNAQFAKALGRVLNRPTVLPVPAFGPRLLLGHDLADALLFSGQRVLPTVLPSSGYRFQHETLDGALQSIFA
jgi:uncharacterized protein